MQRAVDEAAADVGVGRRGVPGALDGEHRDAELGEHEVVADPGPVDHAAGARVRGEQRVEVGHRLLRVAGADPRQVLHRVAQVGELEVEQRGEVLAVVEEVARAGVALHQRRRAVDGGDVRAQPGEAGAQEGLRPAALVEAALPHVELVAHVVGDAPRGEERRQRERRDVEPVHAHQRVDQLVEDRDLRVRLEAAEARRAGARTP